MAPEPSTDTDGDKVTSDKADPAIARLEIYAGLVKFMIGTVALGGITAYVNNEYRNAQLDIEKEKSRHAIELQERRAEVEYLSKFVPNAMDKDIAVRVDFADYMKSVALSDTLQKIWSSYYAVLIKKAEEKQAEIDRLEARKQQAAQQLSRVEFIPRDDAAAKKLIAELQNIDHDLYSAQDSLDRRRYGSYKENFFDFQTIAYDAMAAERAGNFTRERDLLVNAVDRVPKSVKPYFLARLADAYRALHDFANADKVMQQAADMEPTADSLFRLAIMQKNDNRLDLALASLNKAAGLSTGSSKLQVELVIAGYLIHAGQRDEGLRMFNALLPRLQPRDDFITNIAWFNAVADRKAEFYEAFERSLLVDRENTLVWVVQEVDIDKYRNEERFQRLVSQARAG